MTTVIKSAKKGRSVKLEHDPDEHDPDERLVLRDSVKKCLLQQRIKVQNGELGKPLEDVIIALGLFAPNKVKNITIRQKDQETNKP